ncbi:MAG: (2Fe-2S)-binding protein, partial [Thermoplasmata archaeon]|nr:(2Fe-2S)-binding protein [Thermoplasmata archaeon]
MDDEGRGPAPGRSGPVSSTRDPTILDGLTREHVPILQRSIRYHRPRAPFCGVGYCTQCLVRVNGVPNVRACQTVHRAGDRVRTENAWPSTRFDLLGSLDLIFYRGLDTLHGFRRPAFATPLFHRVVRRLAGYGHLPDGPPVPSMVPGERWETDSLVIGAGACGAAAALRLIEGRRSVTVVDRSPDRVAVDGTRFVPGGTAVFLPPPLEGREHPFRAVVAREGDGSLLITAKNVFVATGGYDAGLWFGGSDRPGVMTAEASLRFSDRPRGAPFRRGLVFGGGER